MFFLIYRRQTQRKKYTEKQAWPYTNSDVEHACNSGTTLWNSWTQGKEKKII
jgi:hypothetical protein